MCAPVSIATQLALLILFTPQLYLCDFTLVREGYIASILIGQEVDYGSGGVADDVDSQPVWFSAGRIFY